MLNIVNDGVPYLFHDRRDGPGPVDERPDVPIDQKSECQTSQSELHEELALGFCGTFTTHEFTGHQAEEHRHKRGYEVQHGVLTEHPGAVATRQ